MSSKRRFAHAESVCKHRGGMKVVCTCGDQSPKFTHAFAEDSAAEWIRDHRLKHGIREQVKK